MKHMTLVLWIALGFSGRWSAPAQEAGEKPAGGQSAPEAPAAEKPPDPGRALYDRMIRAMREAETLSWVSRYRWEARGKELGRCRYTIRMKKPNYFRLDTVRADGKAGGVVIGDGQTMWIHWPNGRPFFSTEDPSTWDRPRDRDYMQTPTPVGRHSIAHQTGLLGAGMSMTILDPSTFHGYTDSLQRYVDGVTHQGTEEIDGEVCDVIQASIMKGQRIWTLWLSRRDHLPRKLRQVIHVSYDITTEETWSEVRVNADTPTGLFAWRPPEGWTRWRKPSPADRLLKPGDPAPDFTLKLLNGDPVTLSAYRGKVVWLNFWRAG